VKKATTDLNTAQTALDEALARLKELQDPDTMALAQFRVGGDQRSHTFLVQLRPVAPTPALRPGDVGPGLLRHPA
jgi:hypothetical protein